jgi:hypothetical protein
MYKDGFTAVIDLHPHPLICFTNGGASFQIQ